MMISEHRRKLPLFEGPAPRDLTIIVKPTYACNLRCTYCFISKAESEAPRMSRQTVDNLFQRATEFCGTGKTICFVWHGGEPMLMGAEFYRYIGEKTRQLSEYKIINAMQTNLTLLDEKMLEVVVEYGFRLGTSLDGPAPVHDLTRLGKAKRPTFQRSWDGLQLLRSKGLLISGIAVLNKTNKDHIDEIYDFFNSNQISFRVNPLEYQGSAVDHLPDLTLSPRDYGDAMTKLFDRWFADENTRITIDPFRTIIDNILSDGVNTGCEFKRACHESILSVSPDGNVHPCGKLSGVEDYLMGNINEQGLGECLQSAKLDVLSRRVPEAIPECAACEYLELCNAGCPVGPHNAGDLMTPDIYCGGKKQIFEHVLTALEANLAKATRFRDAAVQIADDSLTRDLT
jgi:uncharacterized protein